MRLLLSVGVCFFCFDEVDAVGWFVVVLEAGCLSEELLEFDSSEEAEEDALEYDLIFSISMVLLLMMLLLSLMAILILMLCGVDRHLGFDALVALADLMLRALDRREVNLLVIL